MTLLTDDEHKRIKELCEKATPGPWEATTRRWSNNLAVCSDEHQIALVQDFQDDRADTDADFIATIDPPMVRCLLAEREARLAAEIEIARLERLCADLSNPDLSQRIENTAREMVARTPLSVHELEGERGWRPISEAPKDVPFLLLTDGIRVDRGYWAEPFQQWRFHDRYVDCHITHWQPLPLPPKA